MTRREMGELLGYLLVILMLVASAYWLGWQQGMAASLPAAAGRGAP